MRQESQHYSQTLLWTRIRLICAQCDCLQAVARAGRQTADLCRLGLPLAKRPILQGFRYRELRAVVYGR